MYLHNLFVNVKQMGFAVVFPIAYETKNIFTRPTLHLTIKYEVERDHNIMHKVHNKVLNCEGLIFLTFYTLNLH